MQNKTNLQCDYVHPSKDDNANVIVAVTVSVGGILFLALVAAVAYGWRAYKKNTSIPSENRSLINQTEDETVVHPQAGLEVKRDEVIIKDEVLGRGGYGVVHKGRYYNTDVAVKKWNCSPDPNGIKKNFKKEVSILGSLKHDRIVSMIGYCAEYTEAEPPFIIMEFMGNGSVRDVLMEKFVQIPLKLQMLHDCAMGMNFLHKKDYFHMDLKAANLLVGDNLRVKVGDFGLSCKVDVDPNYTAAAGSNIFDYGSCGPLGTATKLGTYRWSAPERLQSGKCNGKSDVYSFGIVMWEIMVIKPCPQPTRREDLLYLPLGHITSSNTRDDREMVKEAVLRGERPGNLPNSVTPDIKVLMSECWDNEPNNRPKFKIILQRLEAIAKNNYSEDKEYHSLPMIAQVHNGKEKTFARLSLKEDN
jgi:serine/threonine protein kinase